MRARKKAFAIAAAVAMLAGMLGFGAAPALAGSGTVTALTVPNLPTVGSDTYGLGTILISGIATDDIFTLTLPAGVSWAGNAPSTPSWGETGPFTTVVAAAYNPDNSTNGFALPYNYSPFGVVDNVYYNGVADAVYQAQYAQINNASSGGGITVTQLSASTLTINATLNNSGDPGSVAVSPYVYYGTAAPGPVYVTVSDTGGHFSSIQVEAANIPASASGTSASVVTPANVPPGGSAPATLSFAENAPGDLQTTGGVYFDLPPGFDWGSPAITPSGGWSSWQVTSSSSPTGNEIGWTISTNGSGDSRLSLYFGGTTSGSAGAMQITAAISAANTAPVGPIQVDVGGSNPGVTSTALAVGNCGSGTGGAGGGGTSPGLQPQAPYANATGPYVIQVPVASGQAIPPGGKILIGFPAGIDASGAGFVTDQNGVPFQPGQGPYADINGPNTGTVSVASITYDSTDGVVVVTLGNTGTQAPDMLAFPLGGIKNGPAGTYTATVTTETSSGSVIAGPTQSGPFAISTAPTGTGGISGKVLYLDQTGTTAVQNVTVSANSPLFPQALDATSGSDGSFTFSNLPAGQYFLETPSTFTSGSDDYAGPSMPVQVQVGGTSVSANVYVQNLTAEANAGAVVKIPVGITVAGTPTGSTDFDLVANQLTTSTVTQNNVQVQHDSVSVTSATYNLYLTPGSWMIQVVPQVESDGVMQDVAWMASSPVNVQVNTDNPAGQAVSFTLDYTVSSIAGTVKDSSGNPIAGAFVNAYNPQDHSGNMATTDQNGNFTIHVGAGTYMVGASYGGVPPSDQVSVVAPATGVALTLDKGNYTVTGTVYDANNNPVANAPVWAYDTGGPGNVNAMTDSSGNYTLYIPATGTWDVQAFVPGFGNVVSQSVNVQPGTTAYPGINFTPVGIHKVSGTVMENGSPVPGVMIGAERTDAPGGNGTQTAADGSYTLELPDGTYQFQVWVPDVGQVAAAGGNTFTVNGQDLTGENFNISTGTITVNMVDGNGNLLTGSAVPAQAFVDAQNTTTGADNHLHLVGAATATLTVPATGSYKVRLNIPGLPHIPSQTVDLSQGNATVSFVLPTLYQVTGSVTGSGGAGALGNAWVWARDAASGVDTGVFTDSSGNYTLNLPAGNYRIGANMPGYEGATYGSAVDLTQGGQTVDLTLTSLSSGVETVTGWVYDAASNTPIANAWIWAVNGQGGWSGATSNADGSYNLSLPQGNWTVNFAANGYQQAESTGFNSSGSGTGTGPGASGIEKLTATGSVQKTDSSAIAPASGGTFADGAMNVAVIAPAGAFGSGTSDGRLTVEQNGAVPASNTAQPLPGGAVQITFTGSDGAAVTNLDNYITIEVPYTPDPNHSGDVLVNGTDYPVSELQLAYWDDTTNEWVTIPFVLDTADHVLRGTVDHLTTFAPIIPSGANAPATPTGLSASAGGSSEIQLSWNTVSGVTGYNIYRSATANGSYAKVGSSSTASYADTGLTADTAYYYEVTAYNGTDESAASAYATATTAANSGGNPGGGGGGGTTTLAISTTSLSAATAGQPYSQAITVSGGTAPYAFSVTSGSLPGGLTLGAATGDLSGTPQAVGTFSFTVTVKDAAGNSANETFSLTVNAAATQPAPPVPQTTLTDIAGNWAKAAIEKLVSLDAITGYPDGTFRPDNDITRAEFATVLVKALKLAPKTGPVFADTQGNWAEGYIATAAAYDIVSGYDATHFGPNDLITREQMAAMVVRAAHLTPVTGTLSFTDAALIDPWALPAVTTAAKDGVINGYPDGTFRPLAHATRAEAVTVIAGILK